MRKDALLSEDQRYRYQLSRVWDEERPTILFIMLNPSTADAEDDDPTICRVMNFAKYWGYGGVYVGNLYAFRSTDPKGLRQIEDPVGADNIRQVQSLLPLVTKVIYAWGHNEKEPTWLRQRVETPYCIEMSKKGIPIHPLYLPKKLRPKLFDRNSFSSEEEH